MTNVTPKQMRSLADRAGSSLELIGSGDWNPQDYLLAHASAALRTAADQLEAVRMKAGIHAVAAHALGRSDQERDWLDILTIIPPDTAPQEVTS